MFRQTLTLDNREHHITARSGMLAGWVPVLLLGGVLATANDKGYVIDGALRVASLQLVGKEHSLSTAAEPFSQRFGTDYTPFSLVLSEGKLWVEELSRQGAIFYSEKESTFRFQGRLRTKVDSSYVLYGGSTSVSSGNAVVHWNLGFNSSLITRSCSLVMDSQPIFESNYFHIDLYSEDKKMNVSLQEHPFNSVTSVFQQTLSVLVEHSLVETPICEAISC
ncbi:unnamed protein product [Nezara viridula]|uniref:Uncharacterized protein n=1 Tax=Nezara viridula TaxID=85310 RepID=A0A9P0EFC3_NEZVI|nr:unnamed protein product [Nezara viridula]